MAMIWVSLSLLLFPAVQYLADIDRHFDLDSLLASQLLDKTHHHMLIIHIRFEFRHVKIRQKARLIQVPLLTSSSCPSLPPRPLNPSLHLS